MSWTSRRVYVASPIWNRGSTRLGFCDNVRLTKSRSSPPAAAHILFLRRPGTPKLHRLTREVLPGVSVAPSVERLSSRTSLCNENRERSEEPIAALDLTPMTWTVGATSAPFLQPVATGVAFINAPWPGRASSRAAGANAYVIASRVVMPPTCSSKTYRLLSAQCHSSWLLSKQLPTCHGTPPDCFLPNCAVTFPIFVSPLSTDILPVLTQTIKG